MPFGAFSRKCPKRAAGERPAVRRNGHTASNMIKATDRLPVAFVFVFSVYSYTGPA